MSSERPASGFVAIGRNEGDRLKRCLTSLVREGGPVVYVDSGSTDGSGDFARSIGVDVVDLDTSEGFTMARGRNAGWRRLLEAHPDLEWVHFIDGDCELVEGWFGKAAEFAAGRSDLAAVCGRRTERFPRASVYNLLCEIEWNTPVGEAKACGGDVLMRVEALRAAGGFNEGLIAYEEPDLCRRLRALGWKIWRLDGDMTLHDANIHRLGQWWKRHERAGYGVSFIADLCHAEGDDAAARQFGQQVKSSRHWVLGVSAALVGGVVVGAFLLGGIGAALALAAVAAIVLAQALRIAKGIRSRSPDGSAAVVYGLFTMLAKIPQTLGQRRYAKDRAKGKKAQIIEYK